MKFGMGQSVRRHEDVRFLTGKGQYTDDIRLPNPAFASFHRSMQAHAKIISIDAAQARSAPGVLAVLMAADLAGIGPMPANATMKNRDGSGPHASAKSLLADGHVVFAGEAIAMVVAGTQAQAKDAADLIVVEYESLAPAGNLASAKNGAPLWGTTDNQVIDWVAGDEAAVTAAFSKARHVVSMDILQNRVSAMPMETRNAIGDYDRETGNYTLYTGSQGAANLRNHISKSILNIAPEKLRVVTPDVGGGFGMKGVVYPEQALVLVAAQKLGRPVRWSAERSESFLADAHGRDTKARAELALDAEGRILALKLSGSANLGGYLSLFALFIITQAGARIFGGVYRVPSVLANIKGYFSNTAPVEAYRGAGRPEAAYLMERLMDVAAARTGLSRVEIRKRNLIRPDELPYKNWNNATFDSGNFPLLLGNGIERADVAGFEARKAQSLACGRLRGLGMAYYVEITAAAGTEPAQVRFRRDGTVEILVGTQSNGQGHETAFAQIIAERLGIPFERITVRQGDTNEVNGGGTGGSRSLNMSGGALLMTAETIITKGKAAAGHILQAGGQPVEFSVTGDEGRFSVAGTDRSMTILELARALQTESVAGFEGGLDSEGAYQGAAPTFPNGCHVCEVEIDPDTGKTDVVSYHAYDDFGRVINPMLVTGQVHGGVAQGIGQALLENIVYDEESGQLLTASFSDYAMPRAADVPDIEVAFEGFPCTTNPLGAKGCGEAGTVGALPAIMSAVCDAIGIEHLDMPATPEKVWRAVTAIAEKKRG